MRASSVCLAQCKSLLLPLLLFPLSALSSLTPGPANANYKDVAAKPLDLAIVTNFIPKMAHKWDVIGIKLRQGDMVKDLRFSNDPRGNCTQVLQAAMESRCPPNYEKLFSILNSDGVGLPQVALELWQDVLVSESIPVQQPTDSD